MNAILQNSQQTEQPLWAPFEGYYIAQLPCVVQNPDALAGWEVVFIEAWKRGVLRLALRADDYIRHEVVNCYCSADIFRVAKETHVI